MTCRDRDPVDRRQREIGSDFSSDDGSTHADFPTQRPWDGHSDEGHCIYLESGRQALHWVAQSLRRQGRNRILVPGYLCDSMIDGFAAHKWSIEPVQMTWDLDMLPEALLDAPSDMSRFAVLHAPYFGRSVPARTMEVLETLALRNAAIILDETHTILAPPAGIDYRYRIASLRKLLPVPDGGYIRGSQVTEHDVGAPSLPELTGGDSPANLRTRAMRLKAQYLSGASENKDHYRALFDSAEREVARRPSPMPMSSSSQAILDRLDYDRIRSRRISNASHLGRMLAPRSEIRLVNRPMPGDVPSHLVIQYSEAAALRSYLRGIRAYCPIHWPPSTLIKSRGPWPTNYLSLPVDQRYGTSDMQLLGEAVTSFLQLRRA